jgi:hypothetical protein
MPIFSGGGGDFDGGTITQPLVIAPSDTASEALRIVLPAEGAGNVDYITGIAYTGEPNLSVGDGRGVLRFYSPTGSGSGALQAGQRDAPAGASVFDSVGGLSTEIRAAPATATLVGGTGTRIDADFDRYTVTPVTFNPSAGAAATCAVAISPDDVTYSALWTETEPAGLALDGTIHGIRVYVPSRWYLKLTVANAVIGTTTYY